jgi:hypothetical protein
MSQWDDVGVEREQISPSAVYRQLDDHLGLDEAPYDIGAGLERLVSWMSEEPPAARTGSSVERLEAERMVRDRELIQLRTRVIERTATLRMRSSLVATSTVAFLSLLTGLGLLFGLPLVPVHAVVATVVTIGIIDALMVFAVGYIHRTTVKSLQGDVELPFGTAAAPRRDSNQAEAKGSQESQSATAPARRARTASPQVELVVSKTNLRYLRVVGFAALVIAGTASLWSHYPGRSGVTLTIAGILAGLVLVPFIVVIVPAVWSRNPARRDAALQVLLTMLGLKMRVEKPPVRPATKKPATKRKPLDGRDVERQGADRPRRRSNRIGS